MGADLALIAIPMERPLEDAMKAAADLPMNDKTWKRLDSFGVVISEWDEVPPTEAPTPEQAEVIRNRIIGAVKTVYNSPDRRDCAVLFDKGRTYYITGGMTWGDDPSDAWDDFSIVLALGLSLEEPETALARRTDSD